MKPKINSVTLSSGNRGRATISLQAKIRSQSSQDEFYTSERLFITELWNSPDDEQLSIAKARVEPGVTTTLHYLAAVDERYLISSGQGVVEVEGLAPSTVSAGDVVLIPSHKKQRITNTGTRDLVFYCICTPRFKPDCYREVSVE